MNSYSTSKFHVRVLFCFWFYSSGTYAVDGQNYLEGPKFEAFLTKGMNCEVFIEVRWCRISLISAEV